MRSSSIFINPKLLETRDRMPGPPPPLPCRFHWVISVSCVAPFGRRNILGKHASYHTTRDTMMASRNHFFKDLSNKMFYNNMKYINFFNVHVSCHILGCFPWKINKRQNCIIIALKHDVSFKYVKTMNIHEY